MLIWREIKNFIPPVNGSLVMDIQPLPNGVFDTLLTNLDFYTVQFYGRNSHLVYQTPPYYDSLTDRYQREYYYGDNNVDMFVHPEEQDSFYWTEYQKNYWIDDQPVKLKSSDYLIGVNEEDFMLMWKQIVEVRKKGKHFPGYRSRVLPKNPVYFFDKTFVISEETFKILSYGTLDERRILNVLQIMLYADYKAQKMEITNQKNVKLIRRKEYYNGRKKFQRLKFIEYSIDFYSDVHKITMTAKVLVQIINSEYTSNKVGKLEIKSINPKEIKK
jgi:hypothetical protein